MKVLVTGATGFIGNHVVRALLQRDIDVIATSRTRSKAEAADWFSHVDYREFNTMALPAAPFAALGSPDRMIHLAWSGLPNYKDDFHLTKNLPADRAFLTAMLAGGLKHLLATGTCFEYGMQEGELTEDMETRPDNPYGQAKDSLRTELEKLTSTTSATFQWARLFYMFGPGQGPSSLFLSCTRPSTTRMPSSTCQEVNRYEIFCPSKPLPTIWSVSSCRTPLPAVSMCAVDARSCSRNSLTNI